MSCCEVPCCVFWNGIRDRTVEQTTVCGEKNLQYSILARGTRGEQEPVDWDVGADTGRILIHGLSFDLIFDSLAHHRAATGAGQRPRDRATR